jgi:hypothetical protein
LSAASPAALEEVGARPFPATRPMRARRLPDGGAPEVQRPRASGLPCPDARVACLRGLARRWLENLEYLRMSDLTSEAHGVSIKLAGTVDPDPVTGQLTATFDDNPQLPFTDLILSLKGGPRAPLVNPSACGTFHSMSTFTSWSGQVVQTDSPMTIDQNCGSSGFAPKLEAGTTNPVARKYSRSSSTSRGKTARSGSRRSLRRCRGASSASSPESPIAPTRPSAASRRRKVPAPRNWRTRPARRRVSSAPSR